MIPKIKQETRKLSLKNYKGKPLKCPQCGHLRFSPYAYQDGSIEHETLGRCNREVNCNYHLKPKEYFKNKGNNNFRNDYIRNFEPEKEKELFTISRDFAFHFLQHYQFSTLFQFLQQTGLDFSDVFQKYKVGSTRDKATVFFQFDGVVFRTAKIISYQNNGHRDKSTFPPVIWIHKKMQKFDEEKHRISQCFFGRHLLNEADKICLVESEKTALICAKIFPEATWMASGGRTQLSQVNLLELGKKLKYVIPDDDSIEFWSEKLKYFPHVKIIDLSKFNDTDKKGLDVADLLFDFGAETRKEVYNFVKNQLN